MKSDTNANLTKHVIPSGVPRGRRRAERSRGTPAVQSRIELDRTAGVLRLRYTPLRMTARLVFRKNAVRKVLIVTVAVLALLGIGWLLLPAPPPLDGVSFSQRVLDRDGRLLRMSLAADDRYRLYTPLAHISPELIEATLMQEDQHFWHHPGINPIATLRAMGFRDRPRTAALPNRGARFFTRCAWAFYCSSRRWPCSEAGGCCCPRRRRWMA